MGDRVILHSDINCCYASIEHLHHPELAGKPLAVGGDPEARHGIVLTADYIAKKYGVKTGMALWQAKEVCPDITFVSPRMDLYLRFSRMAHEIYAEYTDRQEPYGIDECWLDVTGSSSLKGDGLLIAQEISRRMKSELGITVSVGVSFDKIFAKLGSDYKNGCYLILIQNRCMKQKFLDLPEPYKEYDLKKAILKNMKKFLLEFGRDFIFIDEEYHVQVGNNDYYVDLLFYHRELQCLVAIDLKIDDFKPEYMGKMDFYLEALDRDIKKPHENPSVGMILCKNADTDVVEYSLSRSLSQTMIAEYKTKLIDKSILQRKLAELYDIAEEEVKNSQQD